MSELALAMKDLEEDKVFELVKKDLAAGRSPIEIIGDLNQGVVGVGELYEAGEYFVSQLMFAAEILNEVMEIMEPVMAKSDGGAGAGTVVIGTVAGDVHDIGKNIVHTLLKGSGFKVVDLGVDVPTEKFIEAVVEHQPKVLGMSALLSFTYPEMKAVVDALAEKGLRDKVQIVIGGAPCNDDVRQYAGADLWAPTAMDTVAFANKIYAA
ncbi:cobalamin-dependent protein [Deltaproteobacteria bacterium OttesenSCG-928-K17]|nr:cobalamin-dependent protein [Deltaproteobacteria bacterium OttesenSCG-928-K17]